MPATYTNIPDRAGRIQSGTTNSIGYGRRLHQPAPKKDDSPARNVRPYLLKKFGKRYSPALRAFTRPMRESIVHDLNLYSKKNEKYTFDESLFEKLTESFREDFDYPECYVDIVEFEGQPRVRVINTTSYDNMICLRIGGYDRMKKGPVKDATRRFLSRLIKSCQFNMPQLWYWVIEDTFENLETIDKDEYFNNRYVSFLRQILKTKDKLQHLQDELMSMPDIQKENLTTELSGLKPCNEKERELVEIMRKNIDYLYEMSWQPDELNDDYTEYCCSLMTGSEDNFCINYDCDIIRACITAIEKLFDGDTHDSTRSTTFILDSSGVLQDIYDRKGFSNFIEEFSDALTMFFKKNNERHNDTTA